MHVLRVLIAFLKLGLLLVASLSGLACNRTKASTFVFVNGYSGRFEIRSSPSVGTRAPIKEGVRIYRFDAKGVALVNKDDFEELSSFSRRRAQYESGAEIRLREQPTASTAAIPWLWMGGYEARVDPTGTQEVYWGLVGGGH